MRTAVFFGDCMDASLLCRRWLPRILAAALAVRIVAAIGLTVWLERQHPPRHFLIAGDAEGYWELAGDLAAGREYAVYDPPRRVLRMPGFPLCLAIPRLAFGDSLLAARLWLAIIGTAACWGVWRLGVDLVDPATGFWAALFAALSPALVGFTPVILSETTFALAMLVSLIAAGRLLDRHRCGPSDDPAQIGSVRRALLTGLAMAAAVYVRPSWLLAAPLLGVVLVAGSAARGRAMRDALLLHAALLAALLPWGLRNLYVTGTFVLTTLWMGPSLYDGLNPHATGDSEMSFFDRDNLMGRGMSEVEMNRYYRDAAWDFVRTHPGRTLQLAVDKLTRYWKPWPNAEQFRDPRISFLIAAAFIPMIVLAGLGAWRLRREWRVLALTAGPILYFAAVHAVFVSSLRYRLPAEYPLLILTAVGFRSCWTQRVRSCVAAPANSAPLPIGEG